MKEKKVDEAVESMQQLCSAWQIIVADRGGEVQDFPNIGMAVRWAESKFSFWNCVTLTSVATSRQLLDEQLAQVTHFMRNKQQAGLLWLFEDLLDEAARAYLPEAIANAGLELALSGFGMAGDVLPLPEPHHPGLQFERVRTEEQLLTYADLNSRAYDMPLDTGRHGLQNSILWKSTMHAYLALANNVPVAAAATLVVDDCLFVALVATAPEEQRKGYGEAITRKVLHEGAKASGLRRATLHATLAGTPVYERIGLHKTTALHFYGLKQ